MNIPCLAPEPASPSPFALPPGACDSHAHIFGPYARFPLDEERSYTPPENDAAQFINYLDTTDFARGVLVTASVYGTDNRSLEDALRLYPDGLRGVAVVKQDVTDAELDSLSAAGVRGARFNLFKQEGKAVYRNGAGWEDLHALAPRLAARGWHAQIWIHAPDLIEAGPLLKKLPVELVIDHMGRMSAERGVNDPGFQYLLGLMAEGRAWTKISGADRVSATGGPFRDATPYMKAILEANHERVVWGSDWPHIHYYENMPSDTALLTLLGDILTTADLREKILTRNPAVLYDFPAL